MPLVLALERRRKGISVPYLGSSVVDEERMKAGPTDGDNALGFLQCFDTVGSVTGGTYELQKSMPHNPKSCLREQVEK